ncbi:MAG: T9SS type A sorting domain-containing protein [Bacteroidia bacterium]|nr:T9SS type A sorting domain-containing protein [Bacteroidia bacterium]
MKKKKYLMIFILSFVISEIYSQGEFIINIDTATGSFTQIGSAINGIGWVSPYIRAYDEVHGHYIFQGGVSIPDHLYTIDVSDGSIISNPYYPPTGSCVREIKYDNSNDSLYGLYWNSSLSHFYLATVNPSTGLIIHIYSSTITGLSSIAQGNTAYDSNNHRYFVITGNHLYSIDALTGNLISSPVLSLGSNQTVIHFCYNHSLNIINGMIMNSSTNLCYLVSIDPVTGGLTIIGTGTPYGVGGGSSAIDTLNQRYMFTSGGSNFYITTIEIATGNVISHHYLPLGCGDNIHSVSYDNVKAKLFGVQWDAGNFAFNINHDVINASCPGSSDGSIDLSINCGTSPFTYLWSNGQTTQYIDSIPEGVYYVTVTDANSNVNIDTITVAAYFTLSVSFTGNIGCNGSSAGYIDLEVTGPQPFDFYWSNGATTQNINNIPAGLYTVTVSDFFCIITADYTLSSSNQINITELDNNVSCFDGSDGSAYIIATGGAGNFQYQWSNGASTADINHLSSGIYSYSVTDNNNCSITGTVTILQPDSALSAGYFVSDVACANGNDGSVNITVSGGTTPYFYYWSDSSTNDDISGLVAGEYSLTITDTKSCTYILSASISMPDSLTISSNVTDVSVIGGSDGAVDLTVNGGTPPYHYHWNTGQTTQDIQNITVGWYYVTITDSNGCDYRDTFRVTQPNIVEAIEYNSFMLCLYPNPFNETGIIRFYLPEKTIIKLTLYDVTGKTIKELINNQLPEGLHEIAIDGSCLPSGFYSLRLSSLLLSVMVKISIIH